MAPYCACSTELIKQIVETRMSYRGWRALGATLHGGWRPPDVKPMNNGTVRNNTIPKIPDVTYCLINSLAIHDGRK